MIKESIICQLNDEAQEHSERVANICRELAKGLSLDAELAYQMGLYHDIGKIYTPSNILKKPGGLTPLEREIIDLHAYFGYKMLKEYGAPSMIYLPVLFHHGYWKPKLSNPEETLDKYTIKYANLLHSADAFDAMTNARVYHDASSVEETLAELAGDEMSSATIIGLLAEYAAASDADNVVKFSKNA